MGADNTSLASAVVDESLCYCSFCSKPQNEIEKLIAGPGVFICNECVALCEDIIAAEASKKASGKKDERPDVASYLDNLDLDTLKKRLAVRERVLADVDQAQQMIVQALRRKDVSWADIGGALGVSRQAVWRRFGAADSE